MTRIVRIEQEVESCLDCHYSSCLSVDSTCHATCNKEMRALPADLMDSISREAMLMDIPDWCPLPIKEIDDEK